MGQIEVGVCNFNSLFNNNKIVVPEYQRPYVWNKRKIEELILDFEEFFILNQEKKPYYLGSILFFHNKENNTYEIIDGQQRITTLLILINLLKKKKLNKNQNISFNSHQSVYFIKQAYIFFKEKIDLLNKLYNESFLDKFEFTRIITHSSDDAFTFFDTQNNRGIKLNSTDFLKAYHLRAIKTEQLQEKCAKQWESIGLKESDNEFLSFFFDKILWRARNWRGKNVNFEHQDLILETFQKNTLNSESDNSYTLYASSCNKKYNKLSWVDGGRQELISIDTNTVSALNFPFSLRQPIYRGLNFFDYTEKYTEIYELLFEKKLDKSEPVYEMREYYNAVYSCDMSVYLREFMKLCLVVFFDIFGEKNLPKAINCFDFLLGALRLSKQQIKREAVTKYLKENNINLLDIIAHAYLPEEVFGFIIRQENLNISYKNTKIKINEGVQGRYIYRLLSFFEKKKNELKERNTW